jgi:hypothetical protein
MVFVAMKRDEIFNRTTQYQIQYASGSREASFHGHGEDSMHQGRDNTRHARSIRYNDDGSTSTTLRRTVVYRDDDSEYRTPQMPREFTSSVPNIGFTTECSGEGGDDDLQFRRYRRAPNRIGSLPFENVDSDDEVDYNANDFDFDNFMSDAAPESLAPNFAEGTGVGSHAASGSSSDFANLAGGELLVPHARFLIEKKKSTCTIRFDPPVSGRFILLKMWNFHQDPNSNIDIQTVLAKGFAGPRYFPSVTPR